MSTKVILSQRRKEVLDKLLSGKSHGNIQEYIQEKYEVSDKAVERDITLAYKTIKCDYAQEASEIIDKHISMYYKLYGDCEEVGDTNGAGKMLERIEKLKGLHKPESQVVVNNNTQNNTIDLKNYTLEELKSIIQNG